MTQLTITDKLRNMTLGVSEFKSDSDLDRIRNFCDIYVITHYFGGKLVVQTLPKAQQLVVNKLQLTTHALREAPF